MLSNKVCVITGANSGIGYETAKALAALGMYVIMVCRNEEKAEEARRQIEIETANTSVEVVVCDFSIQHDIHVAARKIREKFDKIDILINNHGLIVSKREETIDGLEKTFAINHMGYFLFTKLLLDPIKAADSARIINVASTAHQRGSFNPTNIQLEKGFSPMKAYSNSKLFNILFTMELDEQLQGSGVTANCLHPGVIKSGFGREGSILFRLLFSLINPFKITSKQGALTTIYLATSREVEGVSGQYFVKRKKARPSLTARNMDYAKQLWEISENLIA